MKIYKKSELGRFQNEWLNAHYHFSFGHYHNPDRMGFGNLRVINDDIIEPGQGFDPHPHRNMEIITYVRTGSVVHKDSLGNEGITRAGDVQVMSAGKGITHAEFSDRDTQTTLFQIWIKPRDHNVDPRWDQAVFPHDPVNENLKLLVSGRAMHKDQIDRGDVLYIHQDASIFGGNLIKDQEIIHKPLSGQSYVVVSKGDAIINGHELSAGDGAEIEGDDHITIHAATDTELLVIDL